MRAISDREVELRDNVKEAVKMPMITRSQQGSVPPSESGDTASGMTPAEIEILNKRIADKEKVLMEQAEALRHKQEELEKLRRDVETTHGPSSADQFEDRLNRIERMMDTFSVIPEQLDQIRRQAAYNQPRSGRDTPDLPRESPRGYGGQDNSPIRLKDVIDSIPKYDGHKMSVFHFCKMCERALNLIPAYHEYHLVQLVINKLYGHAYAAIEGIEYTTMFALTRRLRKIFGPNKSTDQYRGELANIYMRPNENILDYVERVKELRTLIIDGEIDIVGNIDESVKYSIENSARESFINGLPSDLLVRVKLERHYTLEDAITTAIQLSKTLEAENLRKRGGFNKPAPPFRADVPYNSRTSKETLEQLPRPPRTAPVIQPLIPGQPGPNYPEKVCYYCKAPGHFMRDCRKLAYRRETIEGKFDQKISGNATSVPGTGVHRDATQTGRPSNNVMILQKEADAPLPVSPI